MNQVDVMTFIRDTFDGRGVRVNVEKAKRPGAASVAERIVKSPNHSDQLMPSLLRKLGGQPRIRRRHPV